MFSVTLPLPSARRGRIAALAALLTALPGLWLGSAPAHAAPAVPPVQLSAESGAAVHHDTSVPLRDLAAAATLAPGPEHQGKNHEERLPHPPAAHIPDPVVQDTPGGPSVPSTGASFDGIGSANYSVTGVPPDPHAAVGSPQIVETVNTAYAVYSKTGATVLAPTSTLLTGRRCGGAVEVGGEQPAVRGGGGGEALLSGSGAGQHLRAASAAGPAPARPPA
ncbi:hypothetical protein ACFV1W_22770 [Kitasatospora sp. NPDC059648]|uniref:hypothetical protein n=1 Tax=Kitasatospora sp. NPDC059648 TaxID=3346894 RepID=UPI0036C2EF44